MVWPANSTPGMAAHLYAGSGVKCGRHPSSRVLDELSVLLRAWCLLEGTMSGADAEVCKAVAALREVVVSASAANGALELWTERVRLRRPG